MNFLLGALPTIFSSPLVRNTIGGLANGVWNMLRNNATKAVGGFVDNTISEAKQKVKSYIDEEDEDALPPTPMEPRSILGKRPAYVQVNRNDKYQRRKRVKRT